MGIWTTGLPLTVALAVVAALGYLFGRSRQPESDPSASTPARELHRARIAATQLEAIADQLRKGLASHHASIRRFQQRISQLSDETSSETVRTLHDEAEDMLKPTLRLAKEIGEAYNQIRSQTGNLMSFAKVRSDPLTGVGNRNALDESLRRLFATMSRYKHPFSLAILDIDFVSRSGDHSGPSQKDNRLREVAQFINDGVRQTDIVTRYGGEEFVVLLPFTELEGAAICGNRVLRSVQRNLNLTISGGVVQAAAGEDGAGLLARADNALYAAKAAGRNQIFVHDGQQAHTADADSNALATQRNNSSSPIPLQAERQFAQQHSAT